MLLIEIATPNNAIVENKIIEKYGPIYKEIKDLWKMEIVEVVPLIIAVLDWGLALSAVDK